MKTHPVSALQVSDVAGFTLIELIMGIVILAMVLAIGVPSFASIIRVNRLASQVNEFSVTLNFARSEAYKRGLPVIVCPANAELTDCAGTNWSTGWLAFVDANSNGAFSTGDTILQKKSPPPGGFTYSASASTATFRALGATPFSVEISKSGCSGLEKRRISVGSTGRIKMEKITC
jgi:type IV fimbrial biogenesis protein FimT